MRAPPGQKTFAAHHGPHTQLGTLWPGAVEKSPELLALCCSVDAYARLSIGSLKYMHHLGLDCFSTPEAHWTLQAVLTHSINDDLYALSLTCVLDARLWLLRAYAGPILSRTRCVLSALHFFDRHCSDLRIQQQREQA